MCTDNYGLKIIPIVVGQEYKTVLREPIKYVAACRDIENYAPELEVYLMGANHFPTDLKVDGGSEDDFNLDRHGPLLLAQIRQHLQELAGKYQENLRKMSPRCKRRSSFHNFWSMHRTMSTSSKESGTSNGTWSGHSSSEDTMMTRTGTTVRGDILHHSLSFKLEEEKVQHCTNTSIIMYP